ncbi:hypothetical protein OCE52_24315 [Bacillus mobilis]|uniref:hypothetical protein n=1 Tax=Bacillus mobilis TaxID=2026190 RepID=UPI0021CFA7BC|nr:hypothetical protein [Bacillus mobilis]MCU5197924.1 hypothetical protein [Bacillus mobilis]
MDFENEIKKLIDMIWSDDTDDELINKIVLYLQDEEINNSYKVELLMKMASRSASHYFTMKINV